MSDSHAETPKTWPGPPESLNVLDGNAVDNIRALAERYGDMFAVPDEHGGTHFVVNAKVAHRILSDQRGFVKRIEDYPTLAELLGTGIVIVPDGPAWKATRARMSPAFRHDMIDVLSRAIQACVDETFGPWGAPGEGPRERDVARDFGAFVASTSRSCVFGDHDSVEGDLYWGLVSKITALAHAHQSQSPRPSLAPEAPFGREFRKVLADVRAVADRLVAARRAARPPGRRDCVLDFLLDGEPDSGAPALDEDALRYEVINLMEASTESLAYAMTYATFLVTTHPTVLAALRAEVEATHGDRTPTAADVMQMPYLRAVTDETLRLYPPVWIFIRQSTHEQELGGFQFPAGGLVALCVYLLHRSNDYWKNPDAFVPERFLGAKEINPAYMPFGIGPRSCLGTRLALLQMRMGLAHLFRRYDVEPLRDVLDVEPAVALTPRGAVPMRITPRVSRR